MNSTDIYPPWSRTGPAGTGQEALNHRYTKRDKLPLSEFGCEKPSMPRSYVNYDYSVTQNMGADNRTDRPFNGTLHGT